MDLFKRNTAAAFLKLEPADTEALCLPVSLTEEKVLLLHRILTSRTQEELKDIPLDVFMELYYLLGQKEVVDLFLKENFFSRTDNQSDFEQFYPGTKRRRLL